MLKFVLHRVLVTGPVLLAISVAVFFMVRLVPGDPVDAMYADLQRPTPEQKAQIERQLGLDGPIYRQYFHYVSHALRGDLGSSIRTTRPVATEIRQYLPNTLKLAGLGLVLALVVGLSVGVLAAVFRNSWIDRCSRILAVMCASVPSFWLGSMLILVFSVKLGWFPVAGAETWRHIVMPAFTLGVLSSGYTARVTRASMLEALEEDYVRTARAKGLREAAVVYRHALRNALIPIVTIVGLLVGGLLAGAFVIEVVFAYPGVGQLAVNALISRDFPMIQGTTLFIAVVYVLVNLIVDVLYGFIDPRIRVV